jgi:aminocarboxymuconate-semialdehyde decarboxylase
VILCFHPVVNGLCSALLNDFNLAGSVGTTLEDTLVVLHMIIGQVPHQYPNIKIIVPHFGGLIPMLLNRIDNQVAATYKDLPENPASPRSAFGTTPLDMAHMRPFVAPATHSDRTTW